MNLIETSRPFNLDEIRILNFLAKKKEREFRQKTKYHYYFIVGFLAIGFSYLALIIKSDFLVFLFGTIAVFAYGYVIFIPYEIYKKRKHLKSYLLSLNSYIEKGTITTCLINSIRIARADEFEDESDLYIVEYEKDKILYLWDTDFDLKKRFPCLNFEIYEEDFCKLTGRQIYSLSEKIKPLIIDKKAKWDYMQRNGAPSHLETESISFDKLIKEYNQS